MKRVLGTAASAVAMAWACGAATAQDIQLSERLFIETEGFLSPSYVYGADGDGLYTLGELEGTGYFLISPGYVLGARGRFETTFLDDDLDAQTILEQGFGFFATPYAELSVGKLTGVSSSVVYGAPSAIRRGYGVNFPEFLPVDNPFGAPFSASSSPTFFDNDKRIVLSTPLFRDYLIGLSYAPSVQTALENEVEDVIELAGFKRFNLGGVDLGLSAGFLTGNTNSEGDIINTAFADEDLWATNFGFDLLYGNLNIGGSAMYYNNVDGFDDINLTSYTLGGTYQFGPLTAGLAYGLALTDLPQSGGSVNNTLGDAKTEQIELSFNYAMLPGIDLGFALVHVERADDRFGTDLENEETYGVFQTTFSFGEDGAAIAPAMPFLFAPGIYQGFAEGEFKTSDDRTLGGGSLFFPLYQTPNLLTFADLRFTNDDNDAGEYNVGLGLRRLFDPGFILGGYAYFDQRTTANDNTYYQGMAGLELLTRRFDMRVNAYLPEGGANPIQGGAGTVVVNGGQIGIRGQEEVALAGFDGEVGVKLPLPFESVDMMAYLGGYHFERDGAEEVSGPRGRVEVRFNDLPLLGDGSRATVGLEAQSDDPRGDQLFALAQLRVPFSFLTGGSSAAGLSDLEKRMTERVVRDVDIVVGAREGGVEALAIAGGAAQGLDQEIDTIRYADAVGGGTGLTPDSPTDLATALAAAGTNGLVIVDGDANDDGFVDPIVNAGATALLPGQVLVGGGVTLGFVGSETGAFAELETSGSRATISTTNPSFSNIVLADNTAIGNVDLSGGFYGIFASGINGALVDDVTVTNANPSFFNNGAGVFVVNSADVNLVDVDVGFLSGNGVRGISYDFSSGTILGATIQGVGSDFFGSTGVAGIAIDDSIVAISETTIQEVFGSGAAGLEPAHLLITGSNVSLNDSTLTSSAGPGLLFGTTRGIVIEDTFFTNIVSGSGNATSGNLGTACDTAGATITGVIGLDAGTCP